MAQHAFRRVDGFQCVRGGWARDAGKSTSGRIPSSASTFRSLGFLSIDRRSGRHPWWSTRRSSSLPRRSWVRFRAPGITGGERITCTFLFPTFPLSWEGGKNGGDVRPPFFPSTTGGMGRTVRYGSFGGVGGSWFGERGGGLHGFGKGGKGRVGKEGRGRGEDLWDGQRSISCFLDPSFFPCGTRPFFFFFFSFFLPVPIPPPLPLFPSTGVWGVPFRFRKEGSYFRFRFPGWRTNPQGRKRTLDCDGNGNTIDTPKPTSVPSHLEGTRS